MSEVPCVCFGVDLISLVFCVFVLLLLLSCLVFIRVKSYMGFAGHLFCWSKWAGSPHAYRQSHMHIAGVAVGIPIDSCFPSLFLSQLLVHFPELAQ